MASKSNLVGYSTNSTYSTISFRSQSPASHCSSSNVSITAKNRIFKVANELLVLCNNNPNQSLSVNKPPKYISSIKQLNANLFVYFYESILGTQLIGRFYSLICYLILILNRHRYFQFFNIKS